MKIKITKCIKYQLLSAHLLSILCNKMGICIKKYDGCLKEKHLWLVFSCDLN